MKVAIPIYGDYVSNVFDFAHRLLLVNIEDGKEIDRLTISLECKLPYQRVAQLKSLGVEVLICGAISQELSNMLLSLEIEIIPFITGNIENVLTAYMVGKLIVPEFSMPGCCSRGNGGFGRRGKGCRWRGGQV